MGGLNNVPEKFIPLRTITVSCALCQCATINLFNQNGPEDMGQYGGQALKLMFGAMWATAASTTSRRLAVKGRYTCKLHTQTDSVFCSGHYLCSV